MKVLNIVMIYCIMKIDSLIINAQNQGASCNMGCAGRESFHRVCICIGIWKMANNMMKEGGETSMVEDTIRVIRETEAEADKLIKDAEAKSRKIVEEACKEAEDLTEAKISESRISAEEAGKRAEKDGERARETSRENVEKEIRALKELASHKMGEAVDAVLAELV